MMPIGHSRACEKRSWCRALGLWAGALLLGAGCARDAIIESVEPSRDARLLETPRHVGVGQGTEVLRAEVELFGLSLASLESVRCPASSDGPARIETQVAPAPLVSALRRTSGEARTEFGLETAAPTRSDYYMRDGSLLRHYLVEHGAGGFDYAYDNGGARSRRGRDEVPEGATAHDLHSAMVLLRSWHPRLGESGYFYVVLGRRLWRVDVTAAGPQVIKANGFPQLTHRIDGVGVRLWQPSEVEPRRFSLWLSEDAERVPLRMLADASFGEVTMALTEREVSAAACGAATATSASEAAPRVPSSGVVGRAWTSPALDAGGAGQD